MLMFLPLLIYLQTLMYLPMLMYLPLFRYARYDEGWPTGSISMQSADTEITLRILPFCK